MNTGSGWTGHPSFTSTAYTTTTPVTITYILAASLTFLNTGTAPDGGQGHGVSSAGNSAVFKSYRVSKVGPSNGNGPTLNDSMAIVLQFSQTIGCPTIVIGDIDNQLPTTGSGNFGCTAPVAATNPFWADGLSAVGYPGLNSTGTPVAVNRITAAGTGVNVTPATGAGPWHPLACQSIPQNSNDSTITLQATGPLRELRLQYISNYHDTVGLGNQHIALGDITFFY